jgi:hypothetical protein
MHLTDSEREALVWVRDDDGRVGTIGGQLRFNLATKRLVTPILAGFGGHGRARSRHDIAITPLGRTALAP